MQTQSRKEMQVFSYFFIMLFMPALSFTLNKASTASSFVLTSPSNLPQDMHIECTAESVVSEFILVILMVTSSSSSGGSIERPKLCTTTSQSEPALLKHGH